MVFSQILTKTDEDFAKRLDLEDIKLIIKSWKQYGKQNPSKSHINKY